jgi:inner membrane protein
MFLFGHIGITLGAALAITGIVNSGREAASHRKIKTQTGPGTGDWHCASGSRPGLTSLIESLGKFMDIRLLVLGSVLPDIIDKPVGMFLFGNGRVFTHSLLVTLLVLLTGFFLYLNYKRTAVLAVAYGMAGHLILDQIWLTPATFLWPMYGWAFPAGAVSNYFKIWLSDLVSVPEVYISELAGLLILGIMAAVLVSKKKLWTLLKTGCL